MDDLVVPLFLETPIWQYTPYTACSLPLKQPGVLVANSLASIAAVTKASRDLCHVEINKNDEINVGKCY